MDEKTLLRIQISSYEFYAGLIERAVGGGTQAKLPRWDEQRAAEYRELAEQLRRRLAELEAQDQAGPPTEPQAPPETTGTNTAQGVVVSSGDSGVTPRR